jgi:prepilin-type N-terminal cleavage/methylation domain-containing protein
MAGLYTADLCKVGRSRRDRRKYDNAFTLIELLLVITIIGILTGISVTITRQAYHTARVARTNATITKLDRVIMEMYADFENRRVPSPNFGSSSTVQAQVTQAARLWFLRDMIRMEMPCNWEEVTKGPVQMRFQYGPNAADIVPSGGSGTNWGVKVDDSPLRQLYRKAYEDAVMRSNVATVNRFASAKCLYLVVMYGNPEVRELFQDREIKTDEDGLSYFIDGWGNPIYFLRWAPGLALSERQSPNRPDPLDPTEVGGVLDDSHTQTDLGNNRWVIDLTGNQPGWALLPVIMSSGGVVEDNFDDSFGVLLSPPNNVPAVDPFKWLLGKPTANPNHAIIHNHSERR